MSKFLKKFKAVIIVFLTMSFVLVFMGASCDKTEAGTFYTVTEAYEKGYLTHEQVLSIAYYHSEEFPYLDKDEKLLNENYKPLPLTPSQLSVKMQEAIKKTFINSITTNKESDNSEIISSLSYYGTYNDCIAVMIDAYIGYTGAEWTEKITDININYNSSNRIYIWSN